MDNAIGNSTPGGTSVLGNPHSSEVGVKNSEGQQSLLLVKEVVEEINPFRTTVITRIDPTGSDSRNRKFNREYKEAEGTFPVLFLQVKTIICQ